MKLGEFIEKFSHNNLIRLHYKIKGGYISVEDDKVSMDWEVNKGDGCYSMYKDNEVVGLVSILMRGPYPEAINIVIEKIDIDEMRNMQLDKIGIND